MNIKNIFGLAILVIISGCTTTGNIAKYDDEYYRQRIIKSDSLQQLKEYLASSKQKLSVNSIVFEGSINVPIDGNLKTFTLNKTHLLNTGNLLFNYGLSGVIAPTSNYVLLYCADYLHANISDNFESGAVEISYTLSNMSNDEFLALKTANISDCGSLALLSSNIIYKKNTQITSNLNDTKIIPVKFDNSIAQLEDIEKFTFLINDVIGKAVTTILTDKDMLQALKDFKLTAHKITEVSEVSVPEPAIQNQTLNLDDSKAKCKNLGFKEGSKDFGNCVLQIME
jgi:hypothetical protein